MHFPDHKPWGTLAASGDALSAWGASSPVFPSFHAYLPPTHSNYVKNFCVSVSCKFFPHAYILNIECSLLLLFVLLISTHHTASSKVSPSMDTSMSLSMAPLYFYCLIAGFCSRITISLLGLKEPHSVRLSVGVFFFFKKQERKGRKNGERTSFFLSSFPVSLSCL